MNRKSQGIMFVLGAALCFALMNLFIRLSGDLPTLQKCFFRNFIAMLVAVALLVKKKGCFKTAKGNYLPLFLRSFCGFLGLVCNFYAVDHLNIADATILNKLSPFFAMIFSIIILSEKVKKVEWIFIAVAFAGAMFVVKPTFNVDSINAFIGLLGGLGAGIAYTFVRKLGKNGVESAVIVFCFSAFSCICLLPFMIFGCKAMSIYQFSMLICTGLAAAGGQFCITLAYTKAPAKEISVFDYTQVVIAALLGFVFLGQIPDILSFVGYAIIICTAVVKWKYNLKRS